MIGTLSKKDIQDAYKRKELLKWTWNQNTWTITLATSEFSHTSMDREATKYGMDGYINKANEREIISLFPSNTLPEPLLYKHFEDIKQAIQHFLQDK